MTVQTTIRNNDGGGVSVYRVGNTAVSCARTAETQRFGVRWRVTLTGPPNADAVRQDARGRFRENIDTVFCCSSKMF